MMQRSQFAQKLIEMVNDWCPNDDSSEFDEMSLAELGKFMLAFQVWLSTLPWETR